MSRPIRVAAFGAGWVTTNRHIPSMRRHGGFEVVALVDRRGERARAAAVELSIPRAVEATGVDELDFEFDAVTCGAAPFAHYSIVRGALAAGKHVITEKPFTMTVAEGEELAALARERERTLAVVHNFQFSRAAVEVRGWMESGRLGELRSIWAVQMSNPHRRLPEWFDELPLGLFYDESPHLIYIARAFAGAELEPVSATVHPSTIGLENTPSQVDAQMRAGGRPVVFQINFEAPVSEWQVMLLGERGLAALDVFRDIAVFVPNDRGHLSKDVIRTSMSSTWHHWLGYLRSGPGHLRGSLLYGNDEVFRRFHRAAAQCGHADGIDVKDALAVLRTQHWIVDAAG